MVVNGTSIIISIIFSAIVLSFQVGLSKLFTSDVEVIEAVSDLTPLLAISVFLNGIQPILSGQKATFYTSRYIIIQDSRIIISLLSFRCGHWKWMASYCSLC